MLLNGLRRRCRVRVVSLKELSLVSGFIPHVVVLLGLVFLQRRPETELKFIAFGGRFGGNYEKLWLG